jgi:arabinose-5-phosphate isomerase
MTFSNTKLDLIQIAKKVFDDEIEAITLVKEQLNSSYIKTLELIFNTKGKVIVIGIGKTGIVGHKFSSSLSSTGTPSIFINAAEASHGDLGIIQSNDLVIMISHSGSSQELIDLVNPIKCIGVRIILITGNKNSRLAKHSDIILTSQIKHEACPLNLAPTSSTTSTLVLCDSIVIGLINIRNFSSKDFATFHPGGLLGRRLHTKVLDVMTPISKVGIGNNNSTLFEITRLLTTNNLGIVLIENNDQITGIITDGDIRKNLSMNEFSLNNKAHTIMTKNFKTVDYDTLAIDAFKIMEKYKISSLPVKNGKVFIGIIRLHDLNEWI